jgi:hypothetical protein
MAFLNKCHYSLHLDVSLDSIGNLARPKNLENKHYT